MSEVDSELARVRAAREALERSRDERLKKGEAERRLAEEKLALENEQAIDLAEQEVGPIGKKIAVVNTDLGVVIVKRPHAAIFKRFQDRGKTDSKSLYELVKPSLVYPSLDGFERLCEELPATLLRCADAVSGLAGVRAEDIAGKL
jgi:hypothetical protein